MSDPDLENLKQFYGRVIRETTPPQSIYADEPAVETLETYTQKDIEFCEAAMSFFADDRQRYYLEELHHAKQDLRSHIYLGFTGLVWPEDFETDEEAR